VIRVVLLCIIRRIVALGLLSPFSVFTAEFTAISVAPIHISVETPGDYVILNDSLNSICAMESRKTSLHTHSIVFKCKQKYGSSADNDMDPFTSWHCR
jgi:hypothetical protein